MEIVMDLELFGLTDANAAVWASTAEPSFDGSKLKYSRELGFEDQRIFMKDDEAKMVVEVSFALAGENRQRSSGGVVIFEDIEISKFTKSLFKCKLIKFSLFFNFLPQKSR